MPNAHWIDDGSYSRGMLGLQVYKGKQGVIRWRNVKAKRLEPAAPAADPAE